MSQKNKNIQQYGKCHLPAGGYTIIEALIFLAISSLLAVGAISALSGRQRSTEFTQAVYELEAKVRDIANDVTTGYFANTENIGCSVNGGTGEVDLSDSGGAPGANSSCILIGQSLQFSSNNIRVFNAIGKRQLNGADVQDVFEARPKLAAKINASDTVPDAYNDVSIPPAIEVKRVTYTEPNGSPIDLAGITFFTTFGRSTSLLASNTASASIRTQIAPAAGTLTTEKSLYVQNFRDYYADQNNSAIYEQSINTPEGIEICVDGLGVSKHALIKIGAKKSDGSSTTVIINDGSCS